jgi:hypothetical protein
VSIPLRWWLYLAAVLALAGLLAYARHEHKAAADARTALAQVVDANHAQTNVIDAQAKALKAWRAIARSPADIQRIIDAANANARDANAMRGILERAKGKDRDLPDCIKLLSISLTRTCPSIATGLQQLANREVGTRGDPGPGTARVPR